jgi:hypothetical protein
MQVGRRLNDPRSTSTGLLLLSTIALSSDSYAETLEYSEQSLAVAVTPVDQNICTFLKLNALVLLRRTEEGAMLLEAYRRCCVADVRCGAGIPPKVWAGVPDPSGKARTRWMAPKGPWARFRLIEPFDLTGRANRTSGHRWPVCRAWVEGGVVPKSGRDDLGRRDRNLPEPASQQAACPLDLGGASIPCLRSSSGLDLLVERPLDQSPVLTAGRPSSGCRVRRCTCAPDCRAI